MNNAKEGGLGEMIHIVRKHLQSFWLIYSVSIAISLFIAITYLHYTPNNYEVSAKLMIKSNDDQSDKINALLNQDQDNFAINDEIEIFKSFPVIRDAIIESNSCVNISRKGRIKNSNVSNHFPIVFIPTNYDSISQSQEFEFTLVENGKYLLINSVKYPLENDRLINIHSRDTFKIIINKNYQSVLTSLTGQTYIVHISTLASKFNDLKAKLEIKQLNSSENIIEIKMRETNIDYSIKFLNALLQAYEKNTLRDQRATAQYTLNFINDRLLLLSNELDSVESNLQNYKTKNQIIDISEQGKVYLNEVQTNDASLNQVTIKLDVIEAIEQKLKNANLIAEPPSVAGIDDPILIENLNKLYTAELELIKIKQLSGNADENLTILNTQINQLKKTIEKNILNNRENLLIAKNKLEAAISLSEKTLRGIPEKERALINITRQQAIKNSIYTYLLEKREETAIGFASTIAKCKVIEWPSGNLVPVSPRKLNILLLAFLLGFLFPLCYLLFTHLFSSKIQFKEDITSRTSIPIIGEILYDKSSTDLKAIDFNKNILGENLRNIRTKIGYYLYDDKKTILVTSSIPGEGKSFFSLNLSRILAIANKRVCLINADMRKPTLHKRLNLSSNYGLSDYLVGKSSIEDIVLKTNDLNFDFIPVGNIPPNPAELMQNFRFNELLKQLKLKYDVVVIDTPPIGLIGDAEIIQPLVDLSILVVRQNLTSKEHLPEVCETLVGTNKEKIALAIVFNGIVPKYASAYQLRYGYKYGYNYSSE